MTRHRKTKRASSKRRSRPRRAQRGGDTTACLPWTARAYVRLWEINLLKRRLQKLRETKQAPDVILRYESMLTDQQDAFATFMDGVLRSRIRQTGGVDTEDLATRVASADTETAPSTCGRFGATYADLRASMMNTLGTLNLERDDQMAEDPLEQAEMEEMVDRELDVILTHFFSETEW